MIMDHLLLLCFTSVFLDYCSPKNIPVVVFLLQEESSMVVIELYA